MRKILLFPFLEEEIEAYIASKYIELNAALFYVLKAYVLSLTRTWPACMGQSPPSDSEEGAQSMFYESMLSF